MKIFAMMMLWAAGLAATAQEIVTAPAKPEGYSLVLKEEVRFGGEEAEDSYLWPSLLTEIRPAPNDQIYIFDHDGSRVLLFDVNGKFVKEVARKGEGPGELQYITSISQAASGAVYIMDTPSPGNLPRIKRFTADMTFRDEISTTGMPFRPDSLHISPDEQYMAGLFVTFDPKTEGLAVKTGILRLKDNVLVNDFYNDFAPLGVGNITDQKRWIEMTAQSQRQRKRMGLLGMASDGTVYTATQDNYAISQWQPGEKTARRVVGRKYKPRPFTSEDLDAAVNDVYENMDTSMKSMIARATLLKGYQEAEILAHPPLVDIIPMEDKGFLAVRALDPETRLNKADVFSKAGGFLCSIELADSALAVKSPGKWSPVRRMFFHKGKAYTLLSNEDGDTIAVRYSYALTKS